MQQGASGRRRRDPKEKPPIPLSPSLPLSDPPSLRPFVTTSEGQYFSPSLRVLARRRCLSLSLSPSSLPPSQAALPRTLLAMLLASRCLRCGIPTRCATTAGPGKRHGHARTGRSEGVEGKQPTWQYPAISRNETQ